MDAGRRQTLEGRPWKAAGLLTLARVYEGAYGGAFPCSPCSVPHWPQFASHAASYRVQVDAERKTLAGSSQMAAEFKRERAHKGRCSWVCLWVCWWVCSLFGGLLVGSKCAHLHNAVSVVQTRARNEHHIFASACADCKSRRGIELDGAGY